MYPVKFPCSRLGWSDPDKQRQILLVSRVLLFCLSDLRHSAKYHKEFYLEGNGGHLCVGSTQERNNTVASLEILRMQEIQIPLKYYTPLQFNYHVFIVHMLNDAINSDLHISVYIYMYIIVLFPIASLNFNRD